MYISICVCVREREREGDNGELKIRGGSNELVNKWLLEKIGKIYIQVENCYSKIS